MQEIARVIAIIMIIILLLISEEFRDFTKVGLLIYICYLLTEIVKILK